MSLLNDNQPILVSFARRDIFATARMLEQLKKESVNCVSLLHFLSWEADNTDYLYNRVDVSTFIRALFQDEKPFDKEIRKTRLSSSFVTEYNGLKARIKALVLFKHHCHNKQIYKHD